MTCRGLDGQLLGGQLLVVQSDVLIQLLSYYAMYHVCVCRRSGEGAGGGRGGGGGERAVYTHAIYNVLPLYEHVYNYACMWVCMWVQLDAGFSVCCY